MRDAFGGIVNIAIIVVFLVIVSGYLAFNVTYTKAFRVKNKIIDEIERYHTCKPADVVNDSCGKHVYEYMKTVGYNSENPKIDVSAGKDYSCANGYCIIKYRGEKLADRKRTCYYEVITAVVIDMPIINNIMPGMRVFQVRGSTESFECID